MKTINYILHSNGKKTTSFKEYYNDYLTVINESPQSTGKEYASYFDNVMWNREHTQDIIFKEKIPKLETLIIYNTIVCDLYLIKKNTKNELYIVDPKYPEISGYILFNTLKDNGIEETGMWNSRKSAGLVRYMYINWILKHYNYIMSDSLHSFQAKRCWETLFGDYKDSNELPNH